MNIKSIYKYSSIAIGTGIGLYYSSKIKNSHLRMGIAGLLAQVTTDFVFHPLDLVNTRTKYFYADKLSSFTIINKIKNSTGISGFFRGGSVTILGSSVAGFIYFSVYKKIKDAMKQILEGEANLYFLAYSLASVMSEIIVYAFYYPFDLVKTRIQTGQYIYKNFFDAIQKIWDKDSIFNSFKKLYSGFLPSLTLNICSSFLVFFTFELSRDYIANKKNINSEDIAGFDYLFCTVLAGVVSSTALNFLEVYSIQKIVNPREVSFKSFFKPKNLYALKSGLLARNLYGILYTIFLLEFIKLYGLIYKVKL